MSREFDFDVVVIGAGISGMYQLYKLREAGLSVRGLEASDSIGGVWNLNRYPGCRVDSESFTYGYSWSNDLLDTFDWSERFASQPEVLRYLNAAADHMDIRKDFLFNARVQKATFDEIGRFWTIEFNDLSIPPLTARYVISATGPLSAVQMPKIKGLHRFAGDTYHTGKWPRDPNGFGGLPIDFSDKRVAVIGTGSSGVQIIQELGKVAKELKVFQRTPNWCIPLGNSKISPAEMSEIRANYPTIFEQCDATPSSFIHNWIDRDLKDVPEAERLETFDRLYNAPGFAFWMGNYRDTIVDPESNRYVSDYVANKIRERVKNPAVADKLIPKDHGFGTRRIPLETGYFEVYNQDNVELIDLRENPIVEITPSGIVTQDAEYGFDVIIFATGFDAIVGAVSRIDFVGKDGLHLNEVWKQNGVKTQLGLQVVGFPNMFMLIGPQSGTLFCNMPRCSAVAVDWLSDMLVSAYNNNVSQIEATAVGQEQWHNACLELMNGTLIGSTNSWLTGINSNVEGRASRGALFYAGGNPAFRELCAELASNGYQGFALT